MVLARVDDEVVGLLRLLEPPVRPEQLEEDLAANRESDSWRRAPRPALTSTLSEMTASRSSASSLS